MVVITVTESSCERYTSCTPHCSQVNKSPCIFGTQNKSFWINILIKRSHFLTTELFTVHSHIISCERLSELLSHEDWVNESWIVFLNPFLWSFFNLTKTIYKTSFWQDISLCHPAINACMHDRICHHEALQYMKQLQSISCCYVFLHAKQCYWIMMTSNAKALLING